MSEQESIQQDTVTSVLDLSDEEIAKLDPSQFEASTPVVQAEEEVEVPTEESDSSTTESTVDDDEGEEVVTPKQEKDETPTDTSVEETKTDDTDYKAFYDQVTAQFKANGSNLQFKDPAEIISLMQMGANYNKKMAEFKEPRRYLKMLQDNDLLSEDKLAFLIDVHKKDPNAIAKLVKESGLEMYDLDSEEKANQYKPSTSAPTSSAVELEDVLTELQDAPTYARLVDMVGNKFDAVSRERIASTPAALRDLNNHMANGIFDKIMDIVQRERTLGRLMVPDIEAYVTVGNHLHSQGLLNPQAEVKVDIPVKVDNTGLNARRQAASAPRVAPATTSKPSDINPLSLSDEEFAKVSKLRV